MAFEITNYTGWANAVSANSDLKAIIWQKGVLLDARGKNSLREMVGDGKSSMMPIRRVTDLSAGGGQEVIMTTVKPLGGQGTSGETELRNRTGKLSFNTWKIAVDLLRHAVSYTQLLELVRFQGGTVDSVSAEVMAEWLKRKEEDDLQICARRTCVLLAPSTNLLYAGDATSMATLESADTMTTTLIEYGKAVLTGLGAKEIGLDRDVTGGDILKFMFFAPDRVCAGLKGSQAFLQALRDADSRGPENRLFSGKYGLWDNVAIYPHNIVHDTSDGRKGSPLLPIAYLGTATTDDTATTITGGGTANPASTAADCDFFANFPGYLWTFTSSESAPADSGTHYAMIYNASTDKKYEIFSYTTGNDGNKISNVTRGTTSNFNGNVIANAAGRFSAVHPSGSPIFPCTVNGVPFGYGLFFGGGAIGWAIGKDDAVPIEDGVDFRKVGSQNDWHVKSRGLQSVRGLAAAKDTNGRYPGVVAVVVAVSRPGISPEAYVAS